MNRKLRAIWQNGTRGASKAWKGCHRQSIFGKFRDAAGRPGQRVRAVSPGFLKNAAFLSDSVWVVWRFLDYPAVEDFVRSMVLRRGEMGRALCGRGAFRQGRGDPRGVVTGHVSWRAFSTPPRPPTLPEPILTKCFGWGHTWERKFVPLATFSSRTLAHIFSPFSIHLFENCNGAVLSNLDGMSKRTGGGGVAAEGCKTAISSHECKLAANEVSLGSLALPLLRYLLCSSRGTSQSTTPYIACHHHPGELLLPLSNPWSLVPKFSLSSTRARKM